MVVLSESGNLLIQVKQSSYTIGNDAVREIVTAKPYFAKKFECEFNVAILTNNYLSPSALILTNSNKVKVMNRDDLKTLLMEKSITHKDIHSLEAQRVNSI